MGIGLYRVQCACWNFVTSLWKQEAQDKINWFLKRIFKLESAASCTIKKKFRNILLQWNCHFVQIYIKSDERCAIASLILAKIEWITCQSYNIKRKTKVKKLSISFIMFDLIWFDLKHENTICDGKNIVMWLSIESQLVEEHQIFKK